MGNELRHCCTDRDGGDQAKIDILVNNRMAKERTKRSQPNQQINPESSRTTVKSPIMFSTVRQQYQTKMATNKPPKPHNPFCLPAYSPEYLDSERIKAHGRSIDFRHPQSQRVAVLNRSINGTQNSNRYGSMKSNQPQQDYLGKALTREEFLSSKSASSQHEKNKDVSQPMMYEPQFQFDELNIAVQKYVDPFPLTEFSSCNQCKMGQIQQFTFWEQHHEISDRFIILTKTALQIFISKDDWIDDPDTPLLQIPLPAIESVIQQINVGALDIPTSLHSSACADRSEGLYQDDSDGTSSFLKHKFVIKLKEDFINLFLLDQYAEYGLPYDFVQNVKDNQIITDSNQLALKEFYHTLENQILMKGQNQDRSAFVSQMEDDLEKNPQLRKILINKMLIFSCDEQEFRSDLINSLNKIIEIGDMWWNKSFTVTQDYDCKFSH